MTRRAAALAALALLTVPALADASKPVKADAIREVIARIRARAFSDGALPDVEDALTWAADLLDALL